MDIKMRRYSDGAAFHPRGGAAGRDGGVQSHLGWPAVVAQSGGDCSSGSVDRVHQPPFGSCASIWRR
jgi:hypothetical protein